MVLWSSSHVMGTACTHKDVDMVTETDAWLVPEDCTELTLAGRGVDDEGATKLAVALRTDRSRNVVTRLTKLELWNNRIGVAGAKALAAALADNDVLRELHMNGNHLGDDGVIAIAKALGKNKALRRLGLAMNRVGIPGANGISEALGKNTGLTYLELGKNNIGDAGCSAIAPALTGNTALTTMWLGGNSEWQARSHCRRRPPPPPLVARLLAQCLTRPPPHFPPRCCRVLRTRPGIGNHGARALAAGLADNHHLLHLMFEDNPIDDNKAHLEIETALTRNRRGVLPPDANDEQPRTEL